jgi:hypothetical protein
MGNRALRHGLARRGVLRGKQPDGLHEAEREDENQRRNRQCSQMRAAPAVPAGQGALPPARALRGYCAFGMDPAGLVALPFCCFQISTHSRRRGADRPEPAGCASWRSAAESDWTAAG